MYKQLVKWKNSPNRKPLLMQGARQVGKTYLINEFGGKEYKKFIILNFEQDPDLESLFEKELDPDKIITNIGLYLGEKVLSEDTLIFFDEIQAVPRVLTSLKYFYEQASEYHIVAAGSLLGVSVGKESSFPVGKVNFMMLYPMSFVEFLHASGEHILADELSKKEDYNPYPAVIHDKLLALLKTYLFIGGMPEVVNDYIINKNIVSTRKIQREILEAYKRDFSKYASPQQAIRNSELWNSIPYQLAKENKKFKYSSIKKGARSAIYDQSIEWLKKAGLINVAYNLTKPNLPLSGYVDASKFKLYLFDCGLLGAMLNITSDMIIKPTDLFSHYNGAFIENYVASEFSINGFRELYYWTSKNDAEVDFIISKSNKIYPVEVKSGLNRNLKSLKSYKAKYKPELAYRCSPRNFTQSGDFINLPLYAAFKLCD